MTGEMLNINIQNIEVETGTIRFNEYEPLKAQALELAEYIKQVEVNDENVKMSKKLLASVNNRLREMDSKRIAIKKEILQPYDDFEAQLKEIIKIVDDVKSVVRDQVRELEEKERDEKQDVIRELFEKRIKSYSFGEAFGFEKFIKPVHLNKSVTLKTVELEMVQWLEKIDTDLQVIASLPNSEQVLTEYHDTKDVAVAIKIVNDRNEVIQRMKEVVKPASNNVAHARYFYIPNDTDFKQVELFMQLNNIKYSIEKVEK